MLPDARIVAERSLLAACLYRPSITPQIGADLLIWNDKAHGRLFGAMCSLFERSGEYDPNSLEAEMRATGQWLDTDSILIDALLTAVPDAGAGWHIYYDQVIEFSAHERAAQTAQLIQRSIAEGQPIAEVLRLAERQFGQIKKVTTGGHKRTRTARQILESGESITPFPTGIKTWDEMARGLYPGCTHTILGDTGMGKSTFAACLVGSLLQQQRKVAVMGTELPPAIWVNKVIAALSRVPLGRLDNPLDNLERRQIEEARQIVFDGNLWLWEGAQPTPEELEAFAYEVAEYGADAMFVDSISRVAASGADSIYESTRAAADAAQSAASTTKLPLVLTSQVGREVSKRSKNKVPNIHDGLGAGQIEQNSQVLFTVYNHEYYVERDMAEIDGAYPFHSVLVALLKHNFEALGVSRRNMLFIPGAGIYDGEIKKVHLPDLVGLEPVDDIPF